MPSGAGRRDERTLTRAYDNAIGLFRALARASRVGRCDEGDGIVLVHTGSPVSFFNPVFVTRVPNDASAMFRRIDAFASEHGAPMVLYARSIDAHAIERQASDAGFVRAVNERGLVLSVGERELPPDDRGLDIVVVRDATSLNAFQEVSARAFDVPAAWLDELEIERLAGIPGLTLYLGLAENEPVCTGALFVSSPVAGVHIIGTVAEHRRRGCGEAMTWRVVRDGARAGCVTCALTSSDLSHGMYLRMGFEHVADYAVWERTQSPGPITQGERGDWGLH